MPQLVGREARPGGDHHARGRHDQDVRPLARQLCEVAQGCVQEREGGVTRLRRKGMGHQQEPRRLVPHGMHRGGLH